MEAYVWNRKRIGCFVLAAVTAAAMLWPSVQIRAEDGIQEAADAEQLAGAIQRIAGSEGEGTIYISGEVSLSESLCIPSGANITMIGADGSAVIKAVSESDYLDADALIEVQGALITKDIIVDAAQKSAIVKVDTGGSYTIEDGSLLQNGRTNDGKLCYGGGIWNEGDFQMSGGKITGCHSKYGGGVFNEGTFTMSGGSIENNTASGNSSTRFGNGGGVFNKGTFTMSGGSIENNTASGSSFTRSGYGGGVFNEGTVTIAKGSIKSNRACYGGGGLYNQNPGSAASEEAIQEATVIIDGETAEIIGNQAMSGKSDCSGVGISCGGGLYIRSGTVTMKSGTISENKAVNCLRPGEIGIDSKTTVKGLEPGAATGCGGGVYVDNYGGSFVMEGGTVSKNEADRNDSSATFLSARKQEMRGGGVYVQGGNDDGQTEDSDNESNEGKKAGSFSMTGGSITENYSRGVGSGVYIAGEEYNAYNKDIHHVAKLSCCPGPAEFFMGGNAVIEGNLNDDCYFCDGVSAVITESFADAHMTLTVEGQAVDTVLAEYAQGVDADESDCKVFTLRSGAEQRTVKLRELPPDEGQDGGYARYQLYMAGLDISEYGTVILADGPTVYTGKAIEPEVIRVEFFPGSGKTLVLSEDTDYQVGYEYESGKNTEPGSAKVVVTGIGNYSGQITVPFEIQKRPVDDPAVQVTENELASVSYTYDGKEKTPARSLIELKDMVTGSPLLYNDDYAIDYEGNVNAGTAYVLLNGKDVHYSGTKKLAFTIGPASLDGCSFSYSKSHQYTGQAIEPAVTVKDVKNGLGELKEGTDYTCTYRNNINVGTETAEIIVTGKGNYTGTRTLKFSILASTTSTTSTAAAQQISGLKASYQKVYGAAAFSLNVKASGGGTLTYTSSDTNVVKVDSKGRVEVKGTGKATITVKAAAVGQQYKACEKTVTVTVLPKKVEGVSVSNSKAKKLTVKWKKDKQATGYEVQYSASKKFKQSNTKTKNVGKNTTVKKTVSKLKKGKTYCVRVRSYKKYGKEKLYGAWSGIRRITVFQ